ncbi:MAG: hypothetical protein IT350_20130 [Deltaproteobacteria bacterium]|nr:hypothetical protein [Deltaproteobacteria bacterium]
MAKLTKAEIRDAVVTSHPKKAARIIRRRPAKEAWSLIFDHPEPARVVRHLPVEDTYLLIKQAGEEDALDLLELCTGEQIQGVFDFECWDKDDLRDKSARHWFTVLMGLSDDAFIARLRELDFTLLVLFAKRHMRIERFEEMYDGNLPADPRLYMPPDRRHLIEYLGKPATVTFVHEFTQRVFRIDQEFFYKLVEAVYWEASVDLEEWAYQDRTGRMADRGFPEYFDAIEIFAPVNPDRFVPGEKAAAAGLAEDESALASRDRYLQCYEHRTSFLHRVLVKNFAGRDEAIVEIAGIVNMATVAYRVSFADVEAMRTIVTSTDSYLNIGLEFLANDDEARAVAVLAKRRLLDVYKVGRSLVHRLGVRAKSLVARAAADGKSEKFLMLDSPHREFVEALLGRDPRRLDPAGTSAGSGDEGDFESWREVEAVSLRLDACERFVGLLADACGLTPEAVERIPMLGLNHDNALGLTYRTLFSTAYANDVLGRPFAPKPLRVEDLPRVFERFNLAGDGALAPTPREEFLRWLASRNAEDLWPLFDEIFRALAGELVIVTKMRRPDVRYLSTLLMELPW